MTYLQNTALIWPKMGKNAYLRSMNEKKEINQMDEACPLTPYTMEEINAMIDEGERQFADGRWQDSEEMFRELEEEFMEAESELIYDK